VGVQRHAPAALPPGKSGTHCIGGWVGPRAGLDGRGKFRPTGIQSLDRPAPSESLYRLSYPGPWSSYSAAQNKVKPSGLATLGIISYKRACARRGVSDRDKHSNRQWNTRWQIRYNIGGLSYSFQTSGSLTKFWQNFVCPGYRSAEGRGSMCVLGCSGAVWKGW
jgi:hypothetical protein